MQVMQWLCQQAHCLRASAASKYGNKCGNQPV